MGEYIVRDRTWHSSFNAQFAYKHDNQQPDLQLNNLYNKYNKIF